MDNKFRGERIDPEKKVGRDRLNYSFHSARYNFAKNYAKNKVVLDMGCGTGYGSKILAQEANKVSAIDISDEAIEYAKVNFINEKIEFKLSSAFSTGLNDNSLDMVTCFEMIEHIDKPELLLKEIMRVLKKNGLLIISTPNKQIHSPYSDKPLNPFHKKEYTLIEFKILLEKYFSFVNFYGEFANKEMQNYRLFANRIDYYAQAIIKLDFLRLRKLLPKKIRTKLGEGSIDKTIDMTAALNKNLRKHAENYTISKLRDNGSSTNVFICICQEKKNETFE